MECNLLDSHYRKCHYCLGDYPFLSAKSKQSAKDWDGDSYNKKYKEKFGLEVAIVTSAIKYVPKKIIIRIVQEIEEPLDNTQESDWVTMSWYILGWMWNVIESLDLWYFIKNVVSLDY